MGGKLTASYAFGAEGLTMTVDLGEQQQPPVAQDVVFARNALDSAIGEEFPVTVGSQVVQGRAVAALVSQDQRSVAVTLELDAGPDLLEQVPAAVAFGFVSVADLF